MKTKSFFLCVVGLSILQHTRSNPQQQNPFWIFQQQPGDVEVSDNISLEDLPKNFFVNFVKTPSLKIKHEIKRCFRDDVPTISVKVYYEALCPGCIHFLTSELSPTFQKLGKYIDLELFPYGNTKTEAVLDSEGNFHIIPNTMSKSKGLQCIENGKMTVNVFF